MKLSFAHAYVFVALGLSICGTTQVVVRIVYYVITALCEHRRLVEVVRQFARLIMVDLF